MKKYFKFILPAVIVILGALLGFLLWKDRNIHEPYKIDTFKINDLPASDKPFHWDKLAELQPSYPVDKDGIMLYEKKYYHPNQLANTGLLYLDSFQKTQNQAYLEYAEKYGQKLIDISTDFNGAKYYPYPFPFALHSIKEDTLSVPWYSGMAQGEALSLLIRLYEVTQNQKYLEAAQKTFQSFLNLKGQNTPWTVMVDSDGYYWIEEYPEESPDHTLNGYIYGLYGVYDYYLLTGDKNAQNVFQGSLTTLKHYLPQFRVEGKISNYCLKHKKRDPKYHGVHIEELTMLSKITDDQYFQTMADNLYRDYH